MQSAVAPSHENGSSTSKRPSHRPPFASIFPEVLQDGQDINEVIIQVNAAQSQRFIDSEAERIRYSIKHRTRYGALKCMDGRLDFASMTGTPYGAVRSLRAIGGKFCTFWPAFIGSVSEMVRESMLADAGSFLFITYHYSISNNDHLGCAGWNYDKQGAYEHCRKLKIELDRIFGTQLTSVVTGVETDKDMLTLHSDHEPLVTQNFMGRSPEDVLQEARRVFPNMPDDVMRDLQPFLLGNAIRVQDLRITPRSPVQLGHDEHIIGVGQGFDWLSQSNLALIINDIDPNLDQAICTAASIMEKSLARLDFRGDVSLFTNIPYRDVGMDQRLAMARARGLMDFARHHIRDRNPVLWNSGRLRTLVGITHESSRKLEVLESAGPVSG